MSLFITSLTLTMLLIISASVASAAHPALLAGVLISVALLTSALLGIHTLSWFLYLLALVFLGGVMVVLLFMVSVCANEKFFMVGSPKSLALGALSAGLIFSFSPNVGGVESFSGFQLASVLYESENAVAFVFLMSALVLCLISVVGVSSLEAGPLVKRL